MDFRKRKTHVMIAALLCLGSFLIGCASMPSEVTAANSALQAARAAGKDKQCPDEFAAAEKMYNDAYAMCKPCHYNEAIALANQATAAANALCVAKPAPAPAPAPPRAPAASVSLSANPAGIQAGQCSTLTWSSSNATGVSIDQGVGSVGPSGSKQVCPAQTTTYRATASGAGESGSASATVSVTRVVDKLVIHVNFDFNSAKLKKQEDAELDKATTFIKKYPDAHFSLVGYTDSVGSDAYNLKLSEKRADAVKAYLVAHGIDAAKIQTSGRGEADPVGDNATEKGRAENRRVEVQILSE